ncbi:MAG: ribosomal protection-like ABC-F family protein, partial [Phototrophicaceae bacterium]
MHVLSIQALTVNHAGREIFRDLSWAVGDRDRVGLVGPNGAGKSSLLKTLVGIVTPDSGQIHKAATVEIGYLPQEVTLPAEMTLIQVASILPERFARLDAQITQLEGQLANPAVLENPDKMNSVIERLEALSTQYEQLGGLKHASKVKEALIRLGFTPEDFDLPVTTLSGGQKKLAALARLVVSKPEVILLDEPDNHLDLHAKRHLERFITDYPGAVVIVSHDRYLLDETVTQIAELENGKITLYKGNYSTYAIERERARLKQQQQYITQQKEIAQIEAAIARFELWARMVVDERHIKQARSRRKMLERMEANGEMIEKVSERRLMKLQLEGGRGSKKALDVQALTMGFDDLLFYDLNLQVRHGERVGLIGQNGAGKSVLFKLILGQLQPLEGEITLGASTRVGYYSQEHQTLGDWLQRTPIEFVRDVRPMPEGAAVNTLLRFAFRYDHCRQPIGTLSGGERSRLQLLKLTLDAPNLLLLDEPTNNLDIESCEVLEEALNEFEGAILTIS